MTWSKGKFFQAVCDFVSLLGFESHWVSYKKVNKWLTRFWKYFVVGNVLNDVGDFLNDFEGNNSGRKS